MRSSLLFLCALTFGGCPSPTPTSPPGSTDLPEPTDLPTPTDAPLPTEEPGPDCTALLPLPLDFLEVSGFTGSEDFAFDREGRMVSVDENGNLVGITKDGQTTVMAAGFEDTAGIRYLPNGDLVIANVSNGSLDRITPNGAKTTILSGLEYPNGVEVDLDGLVYVAEQDAGRVRRINPETGDSITLSSDLYNPNGLTFNTDFSKLYVGSFGGGTVHVFTLDAAGNWSPPELFGTVEGDSSGATDSCLGKVDGDSCFIPGDVGGVGTCDPTSGALSCTKHHDTAACSGKIEGDTCTTTFLGASVQSICQTNSSGLFCSSIAPARIEACSTSSGDCEINGSPGWCELIWEGIDACLLDEDWYRADATCNGAAIGTPCGSNEAVLPFEGTCDTFGTDAYCLPLFSSEDSGGLDGINVDACDNVYITEYIAGKLWRFGPEGGTPELAVQTNSEWIPNMHWGLGYGGFSETTLYISNRDAQGLLEVPMGITSKPRAFE